MNQQNYAAKVKAEQDEAGRRSIKQNTESDTQAGLTLPGNTQEPAAHPDEPIAVTQAIIPPATAVVAAIDNGRYLRLGEINALLGFTVTSDFLAGLGFVATQDKNAKLYPAICRAIVEHIGFVASIPAGMRKAA